MVNQFVLNLLVAFVWASLTGFNTLNFIIGFILGAILITAFKIVTKQKESYFTRVNLAVRLLLVFIKELLVANWAVIRVVLSPGMNIKPGIISYPLDVEDDFHITLLANMISLTPGTLSMYVSDDNKYLYIHVMDIKDKDEVISGIKNTFEKGIKEVAGC
ncbi:multicomponent Na+:H+ antiporter subunit E [Desulfitispora alkaliphila]|uniref:Na+/H+ antiporter subunit E n=1 Tax=Desulfitispora alkaliphila TaxID=622674 RepID=UPI003D233606